MRSTAKRRPHTPFTVALVFGIFFGAFTLILIFFGPAVLGEQFVAHHLGITAFGLASLCVGVLIALSQPKGEQTSRFQPVRITQVRQEFLSGRVKGIRFKFTNPFYAEAFARANSDVVAKKLVVVAGRRAAPN